MWKLHVARSRPPIAVVAQPGATFEFPYTSECQGTAVARATDPAVGHAEGEEDRQPLCIEKILAYAMLWQQTP